MNRPLGFISVKEVEAGQVENTALMPGNVAADDVIGQAMAQANMRTLSNAAQLIPGVSNTVLIALGVALFAFALLKAAR